MVSVLFIWPPRTAGTSIWAGLEWNAPKYGKTTYRANPSKPFQLDRDIVTFEHMDISWLVENEVIDNHWLAARWKFAIVRNPWDRLVSIYFHLRSHGGRHARLPSELSFQEYVRWVADNRVPVGPSFQWGFDYANPQTDWLFSNGSQTPDFIGRFEELPAAWATIRSRVDMPSVKLISSNASIHRHYREYYDPSTRELASKIYRRDIETFGYSF